MLQEEQKIVEEAKKDPQRFIDIYDRYVDQIYRYVYRRVGGDKEIVHDLVSQTFYDALANIKSFEWRGFPFSSWLYKIAHNNVLKWYRENQKTKTRDLEEAATIKDEQADHRQDVLEKESQHEMRLLLEKLEPDEREIIRLKYFEGVSNIEIAEIMGLSANHIGVKIYRTLKKLKQFLSP